MTRAVWVAAVVLGCASAWADVTLTVWTGVGGQVRPGAVVPILVQMENDDKERAGVVKAGFYSVGRPVSWASQRIDLPPNATKRTFLYLPLQSFDTQVMVRYETTGGSRIAQMTEPITPLGTETPVAAAVGEWPPNLPPAEEASVVRYSRLLLRPELLPDRFEGLEMFDAILLTPAPAEPLSRAQVLALYEWILRGGTLVVDASQRTDAFQQDEFRALLPLVPTATEQKRLALFGAEAAFSVGETRGEVLLQSDGHPLALRRNLGLGAVVALAVDPASPAFAGWPGCEEFWKGVLAPLELDRRRDLNVIPFGGEYDTTSRLVRRVAVQSPSTPLRLGLVLILTALYALAVGPGDYFLVRWLGKPRMTWLTFPGMVVLFTLLAYLGAKAWIGGDMASRNERRILALPDQNIGLVFDVASVFAPEGREYTLAHPDGAYLRNLRSLYDPESPLVLDQDGLRLHHRIPIWTQRTYAASWTIDEYPEIAVSLQDAGAAPVARIENRSEFRLRDVEVAYGDGVYEAPGLEPGESATVTLGPENRRAPDLAPVVYPGNPFGQAGEAHDPLTQPRGLYRSFGGNAGSESFAREFVIRDALRRGAVLVSAWTGPDRVVDSPLLIDGQAWPESGPLIVQVLEYPGGNP